jgi:hypothetical protein
MGRQMTNVTEDNEEDNAQAKPPCKPYTNHDFINDLMLKGFSIVPCNSSTSPNHHHHH